MKPEVAQSPGETWSPALGVAVVLSLIVLLTLTAIGGWPWVAKFLESSAPAWVQAIGSVAAIFAAILIVQRQHALEIERHQSAERSEQQRRARTLRIVFFSAARTCESVVRRIGTPHQTWRIEAAELREVRSRLLSLDPMLVSHGGLLLLIEECTRRLQTCATLVDELPRSNEVEEGVRSAVMATARECWLGLFEATSLEDQLSKGHYNDSDPYAFDDFAESRNKLDQIRAEFTQTKDPIPRN